MATIVTRARSTGLEPELRTLADSEGTSCAKLARLVARGRVVVPKSVLRPDLTSVAIGEGMEVKVNANLGSSMDISDQGMEMEKAAAAVGAGAHTLMDLSTGRDLDDLRRRLISEVDRPLGTVPVYDAVVQARRREGSIIHLDEDHIFSALEKHVRDGVDFLTLHAAVTKATVEELRRSDRLLGAVSRGGAFIAASIIHSGLENPLYSNYDSVLDLAQEYDFTISLGDGLRPGCLHDATDPAQISELMVSAELVKRAREREVQVMVEGPGHVPLDQIEANVKLEKTFCDNAPFYLLGPLVTDVAPGYDHIVGAIGGALAGWAGADYLCVVTPAEHLCLPTVDDVRRGVIAARIAAHAADVARGGSREWDDEVSRARGNLNWEKLFKLAIDREEFSKRRSERPPHDPKVCSMCSDLCAIKVLEQYLHRG
jgi:phosphomethylpyrimidine synthase